MVQKTVRERMREMENRDENSKLRLQEKIEARTTE